MAGHEPVATNGTAKDRQKNRRVEIFVMAPDVPVVGWHPDRRRAHPDCYRGEMCC